MRKMTHQDLSRHAMYLDYLGKSWWLQFYRVKCYTFAYFKNQMFVLACLYIYLTNIYHFLHCLSSSKPGWKVEKRHPINMHWHNNYSIECTREKIWIQTLNLLCCISWDSCTTGKIIPNSNQMEWSNKKNPAHCEWSRGNGQSDSFQIRPILGSGRESSEKWRDLSQLLECY